MKRVEFLAYLRATNTKAYFALLMGHYGFVITNADRDRLTVAANKFRAELAALQECDRKLWTDPANTRGSIVDKSPIDKAHARRKITHL